MIILMIIETCFIQPNTLDFELLNKNTFSLDILNEKKNVKTSLEKEDEI